MLPFQRLKKNLINLKQGGVNTALQEVIIQNNKLIKDLNTEQQLFTEGVNNKGDKLREYTGFTKQIKASKGQPYDRTTLKDTGSFHKKFYIEVDNQGFKLDSADPKRDKLVDKYGEDIFGLTPNNKSILAQRIKLDLINKIKRLL
jgi:hypothetical protein